MGYTKLLLALTLAAQATFAAAQAWPSKPIRLIIGFPPGGGADGVARPVAEALSKELGQPVIVDNRPGAGTTIAASAAATAAPDGYTLFMHNSSIYGSLQAVFRDYKFQPKDFTPISRWTTGPLVVAVPSTLPVKTLDELIAMARAQPGKLNYASSGVGGGTHLPGLLFVNAAKLDMVHVPYKGGAPALLDLVGGNVQMMVVQPTSREQITSGQLRALAVSSSERSRHYPDVPTVDQAGVRGYQSVAWYGVIGPKDMPPEILKKISDEVVKAIATEPVRRVIDSQGGDAVAGSPKAFADFLAAERKRYEPIVRAAGISVE